MRLFLAANDQRDLGVGLESQQPVDDVDPCVFQGPCPLDVALFVETRLELDQHGHLLAVAHRLQQCFHHRRVAAHAVEGLLDGQHVRISGGRLQEVQDRGERIVGMVQEDVLAPDGGKDPALRVEEPRGCGQKGDVLQIGPIQSVQLFEVAHAQRGRDGIDVSGTDLQVLHEEVAAGHRHSRIHGHAHDTAEASFPDASLDGL